MLPSILSARTFPRSVRLPRVVHLVALIAGAFLPCFVLAALQAQSSDAASRVTLETLSPTALANAVDSGPIPSSQLLTLTLTLAPPPARTTALAQFLTDLQTAGSPNYRKWITPAEFAASYGPTSDELAAATAWAQSAGLAVTATSPSGMRMTVTGYPAQVEAALAVSLHQYQLGGHTYFANATQPSLPTAVSALFTSIEGLDNLPLDLETSIKGPGATPATLVNGTPMALTVAALARFVDQNVTPVLMLDATHATGSLSNTQLAAYEALFQQAAAEGITTLLTRTAASQGFPSGLPEITAVANPGDTADTQTPSFARPAWQQAPGLPGDELRHTPDLTAASVPTLASTISSIAASLPGGRAGNINPILYELGPSPGLYTQSGNPEDGAKAGTWEAPTGLGLVDPDKLAKAFPKGSGSSYASLSLSSYSVMYGTPVTFTSNVTSGTGGPVPTGTVTFTVNGLSLSAPVVAGTASYTTTASQLDAATYAVQANYSGDGTYASAQSPAGQLYVGPEASVLSASVSTGATLGGTYNVAVTDTSANGVGQPTGNVTLLVEGTSTSLTQALTPGTGATGITTFQVPANTVGTLTLSINCTTTTDFTCYNPYTTTVTVAKGTPGITISYTPNLPVAGQTITLNATVTGVGSGPTPTGSVTFYDGTTVLNSANLAANGTVTETGTVPNTSTHTITATYNGDANYNPVSTSGSSVPGGSTATSTSLATSATTVTGGQSFNLSIVVTPKTLVNNTQPTGLVQILDNNVVIGTAPALSGGATTYTLSLSTAGTNSLTAYYPGDTNYAASTSSPVVVTVSNTAGLATNTLITSSSYAPVYGRTYTLTAAVTPAATNSKIPTGNITFSEGGVNLATIALNNQGKASYQLTAAQLLAVGSYTYSATYSGDSTFASSSGSTTTQVSVAPAVGTIVATDNPATVATAASTTVSATVTLPGSLIPPSGTVQVTVPGVAGAVYTGSLITTGTNGASVNIAVPAPPGGTYQLQVACATNPNFSCPSTTVSLTSTAAAKIGTVTALSASSYAITAGQSVTLTATVTATPAAGSTPLSGTVTFTSATQGVLGTGTITNGVATFTSAVLPAGTYTLTADYSGDANYASSAGSAASPLVISPGSSSTTATLAATLSATTATAGSTVDVSATVTLPSGTPSGVVLATILIGGGTSNVAGTLTANPGTNSASTTIPLTVPSAGTYQVTVNCPSPDTFTCNTVNFTLTSVGGTTRIATTTTLTLSPAVPLAGQPLLLTANVTSATAGPAPISGTVLFYNGTTQIGSGIISGGVATASVTLTSTTQASFTAVYSGDTNYLPSTSSAVTTSPTLTPATVTLTVVGATGLAGSNVTLTAQVSGTISSGAAPTGTVSFYVAGTVPALLGTVKLTPGAGGTPSIAQLNTQGIPSGTQSLYAVYSGDTNFAAGVSPSVAVGYSDYSIVFTPPSITLTPGQTGTVTLQVNATSGFVGTIALGCTPPSNTLITCSLSQTALSGGGASILTISTVAGPKAENHLPGLRTLSGISLAALLCCLLPGRNRRRLPGLLLVLLALAASVQLSGCGNGTVGLLLGGGTPLGTVNLTIDTAASNGTTGVSHDYSYQVTIVQ
jgi:hypothetical protein